jgi:hypothetical protein
MWHYPHWVTTALVEERIREAERQAALERLYHEAGLGPWARLEAARRGLAVGLGGWLVAVGARLVAASERRALGRAGCGVPCCQAAR